MTDQNERPKPPARRSGRALGGAKAKTAVVPPPEAELTPERFAAERSAGPGESRSAAGRSAAGPSAPAAVGVPAQDDPAEAVPVTPRSAQVPVAGSASPGTVQSEGAEFAAPPVGGPVIRQETAEQEGQPDPYAVRAGSSAAPEIRPARQTVGIQQDGPRPSAFTGGPAAEVVIRPTAPPMPGGTAFPVRTDVPGGQRTPGPQPEAVLSEGAPWAHGPGRPTEIPETAVILNQRIITRESLDSSVPAALKLKKRIKRFMLDNEIDHLPIGDIVAVALDEWLTARGF
ncbi:hypothetical protein [Streptomyces sp. 4F14]|uniref:hypothetical protein n=1 Tax=Streptomyces sp. 4F14 TaxID=3394380 RepID=UPI003A88C66F